MKIINTIMDLLNGEMKTPISYGDLSESWFYYLSVVLMILLIIIAIRSMKHADDAKWKKLMLLFASVLLLFEVYKQLNFSYTNHWHYRWYAFPFQFCSTPMYVALLAGLIKPGKVQNALYAYLATFSFFAGLAVMIIPDDVFITTIGINIQTMIHHGGMVVLGLTIIVYKIHSRKQILSASIVFVFMVMMAMTFNLLHNHFIQDGTFNMFFINPIYSNNLPVLSLVQPRVPYPVYLFLYIIGFAFAATIVLNFSLFVKHLLKSKIKNTNQELVPETI
jgi:hypothetical protein